MSDCLFCQIIANEIPNYTVYEDDHVLAFLDIHPCTKGHTVVVSKKHFTNMAAMNTEEWGLVARGLKQAIARVDSVLHPDGFNVGLNDNPAAGQAIPHLHWHILPRFLKDGGGSMHSIIRTSEIIDVGALAKKFIS